MKPLIDIYKEFEIYKYIIIFTTAIASILIACEDTYLGREWHSYSIFFQHILFGILFIDNLMYIKKAVIDNKLKTYMFSFDGIIDLIASITFILTFLETSNDIKVTLGIISFLKIARFSDALVIFKDVIVNERKSLLASLYLMLLLTFFLSTILYFLERDINPKGFSSVIEAMSWSIATLATVGYGDVVPITIIGKILGSLASLVGLGMFALPAGILVNGFAQELARIRYITSWNLVAKVPIFAHLDKGTISEIARMLFIRRFSKDEVVIKEGDIGDSMYFILDGEVEVTREKDDLDIMLGAGDFIGEIALIKHIQRTATVIAKKRCEMLELTTYDFKRLILDKPHILDKIKKVSESRSS